MKQSGTLFWLPRILGCEDLDPTETLIMVALADHVDAADTCFPSRETLAKAARCSVATVKRRIKTLAERGYIEVEQRRREDGNRSTNLYRLRRDWPDPGASETTGQDDPPSAPRVTDVTHHRGSPGRPATAGHLDDPAEPPSDEPPSGEPPSERALQAELVLVPSVAVEPAAPPTGGVSFEDFWDRYRRLPNGNPGARKAALKMWDRAAKRGLIPEILAAARQYRRLLESTDRPLMHASSFLNPAEEKWTQFTEDAVDREIAARDTRSRRPGKPGFLDDLAASRDLLDTLPDGGFFPALKDGLG